VLADCVLGNGISLPSASDSQAVPVDYANEAPEVLQGGTYNFKSDVYRMARIIPQVFDGPPRNTKFRARALHMAMTGTHIPTKPALMDKELYDVILRCTSFDPFDRPDLDVLEFELKKFRKKLVDQLAM